MVLIEGVTPDRLGNLDTEEAGLLDSLAEGLAVFDGQTLYVVCHLYGPESAAVLLERAQTCAVSVAQRLGDASGADSEVELVPFGAGPLLPRVGLGARIELVLPHRLSH